MDFNTFYQDHIRNLERFCFRWTGNTEHAKDIAQDSFAELLGKINKKQSINNQKAWIYRVAYNRCVNLHRFNRRFVWGDNGHNQNQQNDEELQFRLERAQQVRNAMESLSKKEKALVILYKEGFSYKEMAEVLEMNFTSVGKTLTRAIDKLAGIVLRE
jgi:RNA polymerase sigma factor (sigma-70 family)